MIHKFAAAVVLIATVAACTPQQFESDPVTLQTPNGPVVCQLYTKSMLDWDRSTARPDAMSTTAADKLCQAEGIRQQHGE